MAIDTSIYQNVKPVPVNIPSPMDAAQQALNLSQLGMRNQMLQREMLTQQAMRQAYANNMNPNGQLDQQGFLSDLGRVNPQAALQYQNQFAQMGKTAAETQSAQVAAHSAILSQIMPKMEYLADLPEDQRAKAYNPVMQELSSQGIPTPNLPRDSSGNFLYDPSLFKQTYGVLKNTQAYAQQQQTLAQAQNTQAQTTKVPAEIAKLKADTGQVFNTQAMDLKNDLDPNKARGGNLAKSQAVVNSAQRLNAIFNQFPDGNIPKAQQTELVSAFGTILNNGSAGLQSQLEEMVPKSFSGSANSMWSWVTNNPNGQGQQKFMNLLKESVAREQGVAENQVKSAQVQRLGAHALLRNNNPDLFWSIAGDYGIKPEDIKNGKYVPSGSQNPRSPESQGASSPKSNAPNGASASDIQAIQWLKTADPSSPVAFKVRAKLRAKGLIQ